MALKRVIARAVLVSGLLAGSFLFVSVHADSTVSPGGSQEGRGASGALVVWAQLVEPRFNLYQMEPRLYRSALPDKEANPLLKQLGVTTVVNFYQRSDAQWLDNPEIRQIHLPFHADRVTDEDVIKALSSIREAEKHGAVLMHCKHGQSRTGLMAAMYRLVYQGWSKEQALDEMRHGGFGGKERLSDAEDYIKKVDVARVRAALESGACSTSRFALCSLKS